MNAEFRQKGQSLLEITITIGLAAVIISALTITTINGLKNSQFSKNQLQATKLAQEGLERVRAVRDRNSAVCGLESLNIFHFSDLWSNQCNQSSCSFILSDSPPTCVTEPKQFWLKLSTSSESLTGGFSRIIYVEDDGISSRKKVTSQVSWTDFSGAHQSGLVTILAQDNF